MLRWDRQLESWIVGHRAGLLDPVFRWLTYVGEYGAVWLAIALVLALARRRAGVFAWVLATELAADLSTDVLKEIFDRARPHVHTLVAEPHSGSFPSGHAATSFACATVLGVLAPSVRLPLFVLAAAVAFSRLYVGVHYPLDVLAGALWGLTVGFAALRAGPAVQRRLLVRASRSRPRPRA
jgi:undecaprenyl-diphosphatase